MIVLAHLMKNKVRMYRAMTNITQEELAKKVGVSRQRIIAIENETSDPSLGLALKISRLFKVRVEDLFTPE